MALGARLRGESAHGGVEARQVAALSGEHPFEPAFHRVQSDLYGRVFPEQDVVLKVNASTAQLQMQGRHEFAFDMVSDTAESLVLSRGG